MAFVSTLSEQQGPIELKIVFDTRLEALQFYYELREAKSVWSESVQMFFAGLESAADQFDFSSKPASKRVGQI